MLTPLGEFWETVGPIDFSDTRAWLGGVAYGVTVAIVSGSVLWVGVAFCPRLGLALGLGLKVEN